MLAESVVHDCLLGRRVAYRLGPYQVEQRGITRSASRVKKVVHYSCKAIKLVKLKS